MFGRQGWKRIRDRTCLGSAAQGVGMWMVREGWSRGGGRGVYVCMCARVLAAQSVPATWIRRD
eukprot:353747-Chlamydomonas_euryale.AAC.3